MRFICALGVWFAVMTLASCSRNGENVLESELIRYIADKDARIGVAVIADGTELAAVNGDEAFPMLSVYKFPQALAVVDYCRRNNISLADTVQILADELKENTWSPMRDKYGVRDIRVPISELLAFTLQQSDNNACDVLFRFIGGTAVTDSLLKSAGYRDIHVLSTEDEMHTDLSLCYHNSSTPRAMARLLEHFDADLRGLGAEYAEIAALMESCETGTDRLAVGLPDEAVLGHKTGTGDRNPQGQIIGFNDVGYVHLPDGRRYVVAVFVADSGTDTQSTARLIADLSTLISHHLLRP